MSTCEVSVRLVLVLVESKSVAGLALTGFIWSATGVLFRLVLLKICGFHWVLFHLPGEPIYFSNRPPMWSGYCDILHETCSNSAAVWPSSDEAGSGLSQCTRSISRGCRVQPSPLFKPVLTHLAKIGTQNGTLD